MLRRSIQSARDTDVFAKLHANAKSWILPLAAIAIVAVMQFMLIFNRAINWDEFYHYSRVVLLANGTLTLPLQTLYTRLFVWVVALPGNGVDHIVLIRVFIYLCELITLIAITGIATRFSNRTTGLLCALSYLSAGFVFQHGFSFRFDPPTAALLMLAIWILLKARLDAKVIAVVGLLVGLAFMMTIKSLLYAPAFAGIIWLRWHEQGKTAAYLLKITLTGLCAIVAFALIYLMHSHGLDTQADAEAKSVVTRSAAKMFSIGYQPYWLFVLKGAILAPILAVAILVAPILLLRRRALSAETIALVGLFLPITTLLFYHNTAPYYYVFMLPPVVVACAPVFAIFANRYGTGFVALALLCNAGAVQALERKSPIKTQRQLLQAVDSMFPEPVAYFDLCAMIGQFPKANIFMTPWGMEQYKNGLEPSMRAVMARQTVPLVMINDPMFDNVFKSRRDVPEFLPEDLVAMRSTYIPLWGPFWIAGQVLPAGGGDHRFDLLVPGPYTVRGNPITIDGETVGPGQIIQLNRGPHVARSEGKEARLVWGRNIQIPTTIPPTEPYFTPF